MSESRESGRCALMATNGTDSEWGLVFHSIHGSFVDGYGVRTTVFLKGCPLRCAWCCNPEGQQRHPEIKLAAEKCDGCGRCVPACPAGALRLDAAKNVVLDRVPCTNCGKCIDVCYTGALDFFGQHVTVDELFETVRKDEQYYRASGGGVTIGGGEPTFQPLFTRSLVRKCRENYIHVAVDTCGYTLAGEGLDVLKEADLLLFDLKGIDPAKHRENTGVTNEPVLANLEMLSAMGKPVIVRVPLIPGYTDSAENIGATARFLSTLKSLQRVDLLAFHEFGKIKYEQLGMAYPLQGTPPLGEARLQEILETFQRYCPDVQLGG
ncbi:glycyl-radical enzyme activating protein [Chloroflexota bacterium]